MDSFFFFFYYFDERLWGSILEGLNLYSGREEKKNCQITCKSLPSALQPYHSDDFKISWAKSENRQGIHRSIHGLFFLINTRICFESSPLPPSSLQGGWREGRILGRNSILSGKEGQGRWSGCSPSWCCYLLPVPMFGREDEWWRTLVQPSQWLFKITLIWFTEWPFRDTGFWWFRCRLLLIDWKLAWRGQFGSLFPLMWELLDMCSLCRPWICVPKTLVKVIKCSWCLQLHTSRYSTPPFGTEEFIYQGLFRSLLGFSAMYKSLHLVSK